MKLLAIFLCMFFGFCQKTFSQDLPTYLNAAQEYYNLDNYKEAYPVYKKIVTELNYNDGLILYQYYYCYRVLYGIDEECKQLLLNAYNILLIQYPNHEYSEFAYNRLNTSDFSYNVLTTNTPTTTDESVGNDYTTSSTIYYSQTNSNYPVAENGDIYNHDNDGDGRTESVYVSGYYKQDGTYVRSHYRASPNK